MEDTETLPERHAFLGNYRRFSSHIIEHIVQLKLTDAVSHILGRTEYILQNLYVGQAAFNSKNVRELLISKDIRDHCSDKDRKIIFQALHDCPHSRVAFYRR